jgi:microcystin degradation protein MlrC
MDAILLDLHGAMVMETLYDETRTARALEAAAANTYLRG